MTPTERREEADELCEFISLNLGADITDSEGIFVDEIEDPTLSVSPKQLRWLRRISRGEGR